MVLPKALLPCRVKKSASRAALARAEKQLKFELPDDYKEALLESDGFQGFIGDGDYVQLWPVAKLASLNRAYDARSIVPDGVLLGSNGGGEGYWLRKKRGRLEYVLIPFSGGEEADAIKLGTTFSGFIKKLGVGAFP